MGGLRAPVLAGGLMLLAFCAGAADAPPPAWAYPMAKEKMPFPSLPPAQEFHVEGSTLTFTGEQLNHMRETVDWLPGEHPAAPDIVVHGDPDKKIEPCANCHGMGGQGSLEAPSLAGLPQAYIAEQLHEFAAGRRHTGLNNYRQAQFMAELATKLSESEIDAAVRYFASLKPLHHVHVIEAAEAPRTFNHFFGWQELAPEGGTQRVDHQIIEVAQDFVPLWIGDPHAELIAYAPQGAIGRGEALVHKTCISCHGATLKGLGKAPSLAGRDPHYLARALWDIKTGARRGPSVALMQKPAKDLTADTIADIVAYLASLDP